MTKLDKETNRLICEYIHEDFLEFQRMWNESDDYLEERIEHGKMRVQLLADMMSEELENVDWQTIMDVFRNRRNASPAFLSAYSKITGKGNSWIGQIYKKALEEVQKETEGNDYE